MHSIVSRRFGRRAHIAFAGLVAALTAALSLAGTASAAPTGWLQIRPAHVGGMCLDVANQNWFHLADVIQGTCWNGWNQQWRLERVSTTQKLFFIRPRHSPYSMCLDVAHASTAHGADVIQGRCSGGTNQMFKFVAEDDISNRYPVEPTAWGRYRVVAVHSGKCLDVAGMSLSHTANVIQGTCWNPGYNQRWTLVPTWV